MGHYMVQSPGKLLPACECYHTVPSLGAMELLTMHSHISSCLWDLYLTSFHTTEGSVSVPDEQFCCPSFSKTQINAIIVRSLFSSVITRNVITRALILTKTQNPKRFCPALNLILQIPSYLPLEPLYVSSLLETFFLFLPYQKNCPFILLVLMQPS